MVARIGFVYSTCYPTKNISITSLSDPVLMSRPSRSPSSGAPSMDQPDGSLRNLDLSCNTIRHAEKQVRVLTLPIIAFFALEAVLVLAYLLGQSHAHWQLVPIACTGFCLLSAWRRRKSRAAYLECLRWEYHLPPGEQHLDKSSTCSFKFSDMRKPLRVLFSRQHRVHQLVVLASPLDVPWALRLTKNLLIPGLGPKLNHHELLLVFEYVYVLVSYSADGLQCRWAKQPDELIHRRQGNRILILEEGYESGGVGCFLGRVQNKGYDLLKWNCQQFTQSLIEEIAPSQKKCK